MLAKAAKAKKNYRGETTMHEELEKLDAETVRGIEIGVREVLAFGDIDADDVDWESDTPLPSPFPQEKDSLSQSVARERLGVQ